MPFFCAKKSAVPGKGQEGRNWGMALSDPGFLLLFAGIFAVWHLMGRFGAGRWRWLALLASNLLFYALGATPTLWYSLAAATLAAFAAALAMDATENKALAPAGTGSGSCGDAGISHRL